MTTPIRVYVGTDRSQMIGVKVLESSIQEHSSLPVEVIPMMNLPLRPPKDPRQDQRTGFSFSRFCIPKLAGYKGRAIYMDADMLVFKDLASLWSLPFDGKKVLIQEDLTAGQADPQGKLGAPETRVKQCSVMLLDCAALDWEIEQIVQGLDEKRYDYDRLMHELCILEESEVGYSIPYQWNSLEHFDSDTCLIHYTDMRTQPWVSSLNPNGYLWVNALRRAIELGQITWQELETEIRLGYARPSLLSELRSQRQPKGWTQYITDRLRGFHPHRQAYKERLEHLKSLREQAH